jgi:hypothetical protein
MKPGPTAYTHCMPTGTIPNLGLTVILPHVGMGMSVVMPDAFLGMTTSDRILFRGAIGTMGMTPAVAATLGMEQKLRVPTVNGGSHERSSASNHIPTKVR